MLRARNTRADKRLQAKGPNVGRRYLRGHARNRRFHFCSGTYHGRNRKTETVTPCRSSRPISDSEWVAVEKSFRQENARSKLLQPILQIPGPLRLIPKAEIETDDARLRLKYPGRYNRLPESIEYAAVSAVGFSPDKTKAMVLVRLRTQGAVQMLERRGEEWARAYVTGGGCQWIA